MGTILNAMFYPFLFPPRIRIVFLFDYKNNNKNAYYNVIIAVSRMEAAFTASSGLSFKSLIPTSSTFFITPILISRNA